MRLTNRSSEAEIIDGGGFTPEELAGNLDDIEIYNRLTGGAAAILAAAIEILPREPGAEPLRMLDIGAGSADIGARMADGLAKRGFRLPAHAGRSLVVAADSSEAILDEAIRRRARGGGLRLLGADARSLPHPDGAFDLAWSSLLMHHLGDAGILAALREMRRVTRRGFAVSDLRRSALALSAVWLLTRLTTRNRLTLNDGPLSVRRALTPRELTALALRAGLEPREREKGSGFTVARRGPARLLLVYRHPASRCGGRSPTGPDGGTMNHTADSPGAAPS